MACVSAMCLLAAPASAVTIAQSPADQPEFLQLAQIEADSAVEASLDSLNQGLYLEEEAVLEPKQSKVASALAETIAPEVADKIDEHDTKVLDSDKQSVAPTNLKLGKQQLTQLPAQYLEETMLAQIVTEALSKVTLVSQTDTESEESNTMRHLKAAGKEALDFVTSLAPSASSNPVDKKHALLLLVFAIASIVGCCASTTVCVRAARDSNIAMNALNIRRKYHRNMQLYMLVREKMMVDKQFDKAQNGASNSQSTNESRSQTDGHSDDSSFTSSSFENSASYDNGNANGALGLMHPSDMILEQSNDDDESYLDTRPRRGIDLLSDQEHISLIEDDYIIVDPITEQYRQNKNNMSTMKKQKNKSFFEENLMAAVDQSPMLMNKSMEDATFGCNANAAASHISHINEDGAGLTECSEDEDSDSDCQSECSDKSESSNGHFQLDGMITETDAQ